MRKLQVPAMAVLAVGLLVGSTVRVAAQDEDSMDPALITGVFDGQHPSELRYFEDVSMEGFVRQHEVEEGHAEMSDPRLTGTVTIDWTVDRFEAGNHGDTDVGWGTVRVNNDAGSWEGRLVTTSDISADGRGLAFIELVGSGAYEGLSTILFEAETSAGDAPWNGIIFPGELPADRGIGSLVPRAD